MAKLRAVLGAVRPGELTRSEFEIAFLAFVERNGLPRPLTNYRAPWGELDSRRAHDTDGAFVRDRARDREAPVAGWRVVRATHLDRLPARQLRRLTA